MKRPLPNGASVAERLAVWSEPDLNGGCLLWTGAVSHGGYGRLFVGKSVCAAHRLSWEVANGPIPAGLHVLHRCDNPPCINPDHLFLGTPADNAADRERKGRGARNWRAKLTAENVLAITEQLGRGRDVAYVANDFGVHRSTIYAISTGRRWGDVTGFQKAQK